MGGLNVCSYNLKGKLLPSERWHIAMQKVAYWNVKGYLLECV